MERQFVKSSNLVSVGYEDGTLQVEFKNGEVYNYFDVPPELYQSMIGSPSLGGFLNTYIKPTYRVERVVELKERTPESKDAYWLQQLQSVYLAFKQNKPNDKSDKDRYYAVTLTELEKALAYFKTYVVGT